MGLSAEQLHAALDALGGIEPRFAEALARVGYPEPRIRAPGYTTLLRTIVGQQVSVQAASAIWAKVEAAVGDVEDPRALIAASDETLRGAGLSRQKIAYARSLAEEVASGRLDLRHRPLVRRNLSAVRRRAARYLAGGRPGGADRDRPHPGPGRTPERAPDARFRGTLAPASRRRRDLRLAPLQKRHGSDLNAKPFGLALAIPEGIFE
jgi:hypothetical protein